MSFLLPDKVLDELTCSICYKFLSVKPVRIYPNRSSVCGRCVGENSDKYGANSLYNLISGNSIFKCINRYDGCKELLRYSEVAEHEKTCLSQVYQCPVCFYNNDIPSYFFLKHFQDDHKHLILNQRIIIYNLNSHSNNQNIVYIYREEDYLFFINLFSRPNSAIEINLLIVGEDKSVLHKFTIVSDNETTTISSGFVPCKGYKTGNNEYFLINLKDYKNRDTILIKFDLQFNENRIITVPPIENFNICTDKLSRTNSTNHLLNYLNLENIPFTPMAQPRLLRKMYLTSEFKEKYPEITLSDCKFGLAKRKKNTFPICINCQGFWYTLYVHKKHEYFLCYFCFNITKQSGLVQETDYSNTYFSAGLLASVEFFCSFNCGETFEYLDCLYHEWGVKQSIIRQKCFKCNNVYTLSELIQHMKKIHDINGNVTTEFGTISDFDKLVCGYLFLNDQLILVQCVGYIDNQMDIKLSSSTNNQQTLIGLLFDKKDVFLKKFKNNTTIDILKDFTLKVIISYD